jgi:hypothetical protein
MPNRKKTKSTPSQRDEFLVSSNPMPPQQQPASPHTPLWWVLLTMLLSTGGVVQGAIYFSSPSADISQQSTSTSTVPQPRIFTRLHYELLKVGMSPTDAQARIGSGVEDSLDKTTATYRWTNSDGSGITAVFKDGRLVSKSQKGLH